MRVVKILDDFPWQRALNAVAVLLILLTGLVITVRLAFGATFPDGYDSWIWALIGMSGVSTAGMIGKRATDFRYASAKRTGEMPEGE